MHVLFIYPDIGQVRYNFHQGIAYMSSLLKANGHQTSLFYVIKDITRSKLIKELKRSRPDIVGFSATTNQYPYVEKYANWIKEELETPIICGGVHATLCPGEVLSCKGIDMVCIGEGEYPMVELANHLERGENTHNIQNLWIKKHGSIMRNPLRPLISNLDELPFPDRELFHFEELLKKWDHIAEFIAGRGCPYNCTYCCNFALREVYKGKGKYVRMRSVENVLAEIRSVTEKYDVKKIFFHDDTFTLIHPWIREFCEKYPKEFDLPFGCNVRVETVNREILYGLRKAGCEVIHIGLESGNEWLRRSVLKRPMTNQQIIDVFKIAHEIGLRTLSFSMFGIPFETPEMVEETIKLNKVVQPSLLQFSVFYPYPNTKLWEVCKKNKFLTQDYMDSYFEDKSTLNLPTISSEQIAHFHRIFLDLALQRYMKTHHPTLYKYLEPLLRPWVLRNLKKLKEAFRQMRAQALLFPNG